MIRLPLLAAALAFTGSAAPIVVTGDAVAQPTRIVSANLCADQLLLAVADPAQIAALTRNARDPWMSAAAKQAQPFRMIRGTAEEILTLDPDLIVGAPEFRTTQWRGMARRNIAALDLPFANSLSDIQTQLRAVATATGHPARGQKIAAQMDAALAKLRRTGQGRVAAYYQRRGYVTGTGTLVDELMTRAGLVNLATQLGKGPLARLTLEEMVAANPDILIVETDSPTVTDQGAEMLQHPALRHIPRVSLPQAWTVCGGPAYVQAARSLTTQLAAIPAK
ncbi:ABC transporter substrate-binding protein [Sphingomonas sp. LT1P40]|uniref:ABC transporter substrate-binding protein n=1 Tax=Alteristakelama amylovorans TaxID=3096166 RepID=UPI002FC83BC1